MEEGGRREKGTGGGGGGQKKRVEEFITRWTATLPEPPQNLRSWACSNKDSILGINSGQRCAVKCSREYGKWSWRILHWAVPKLQEARAEQVRDMPSQELRAEIF